MAKSQGLTFGTLSDARAPSRNIIVIGPKGHGKTAFINILANYIMGVEWQAKHRFSITESSMKGWTTRYDLKWQKGFRTKYSLRIYDVPGHINGPKDSELDNEYDSEALSALQTLVEGIGSIYAIMLVMDTNAITWPKINEILSVFGKDTADNGCFICNIFDGERVTLAEEVPFSKNVFEFYCNKEGLTNKSEWDQNQSDMAKLITWLGNRTRPSAVVETKRLISARLELIPMLNTIREKMDELKGAKRLMEESLRIVKAEDRLKANAAEFKSAIRAIKHIHRAEHKTNKLPKLCDNVLDGYRRLKDEMLTLQECVRSKGFPKGLTETENLGYDSIACQDYRVKIKDVYVEIHRLAQDMKHFARPLTNEELKIHADKSYVDSYGAMKDLGLFESMKNRAIASTADYYNAERPYDKN